MEFWIRVAKSEQRVDNEAQHQDKWEGFWPNGYQWSEGQTYEEAREKLGQVIIKWVADTWGNLKDLPDLVDADKARTEDPSRKGGWERWEVPRKALLALAIKRARLGQNLTMGKVARRLDVSEKTYRRWEDPFTFNPTLETLEKIAHVLRVRLVVDFAEPLDPQLYGTWQEVSGRNLA